jgi:DNA-directed RNA polymerase II subunit RPB1
LDFNFIHPSYRVTVIQIMNCVCQTCNKLLMSEIAMVEKGFNIMRGNTRLSAISNESLKITCSNPNCGLKIIFKTSKGADNTTRQVPYYIKHGRVEEERYMSVEKIKSTLSAMTPKDIKLLGFEDNDPVNFIMDYIPIIPMTDRPPAFTDSEKKDHSFTFAFNEILSKHLESIYQENQEDREECYRKIIFIYQHLIDNKKGEYTRNQAEAVGSIKDELVGKEGIIRGKMLGKRSDYTARTVLGPNNKLNFGYLAMPNIMKQITVPEIITRYNYEYIMDLAKRGLIEFFCPKEGNLAGMKWKFDLNNHIDVLNFGDKIERHSEDGDVVIFNRQPTLQKQSMLGYIAKHQDKLSVGVHLSSCKGLNADYDGDEGNEHFVQTVDAQTEARLIMSPQKNIISVSSSTPEAALEYNSIVSAYLLSDDKTMLTSEEYQKGLDTVFDYSETNYARDNYSTLKERLGDIEEFSGKSLISILFPKDFWYSGPEGVLISNGIIRSGKLASPHIGGGTKSIIQSIYKWYGKDKAGEFISAANFLLNWYIFRIGFTLSFEDITLREHEGEFRKKRKEMVDSENNELMNMENLENPTLVEIEERETDIKTRYDNLSKKITKEVTSYLDKDNSIFVMVNSGAKGNEKSVVGVVGSMGPAMVSNELPKKSMTGNSRWLTTFHADDNRIESRGYAVNSYYEGLDVDAYFALSQSGRIGLIDTAVKTATIGYMQRKMVKAQEDLIVNYDGSIRNQVGTIFQFSYGPNFNISEMVLDNSDDGFGVFSFININELFGRINYKNGFSNFDIKDEIKGVAEKINKKYGFVAETDEPDIFNKEDDVEFYEDEDFDEFE